MTSRFPHGLPDPSYWTRPPWSAHPFRNLTIETVVMPAVEGGHLLFKFTSFPASLRLGDCGVLWLTVHALPRDPHRWWIAGCCPTDYRPGWLEGFARRFAADPAAREAFRPSRFARHPVVPVQLPTGPAEVDEQIAPAIVALNRRGTITLSSCQGGGEPGRYAYIGIAASCAFPTELVAAWRRAGFSVRGDIAIAYAPVGLTDLVAARFRAALNDWMAGCLDLSGARYRTTEPRPPSLPVLPPGPTVSPSRSAPRVRL